MKKLISIIIAFATITTAQAASTEVARLTLTAEGSAASSDATVRVDPAVGSPETTSYFEETSESENVNIYIIDGSDKWSAYKLNVIRNLKVGFLTNRKPAANQHYTITFTVPTSTEGLKLYDLHAGKSVDITDGDTYEFDVNTTLEPGYVSGTNYRIGDRFLINLYPAPSGSLETCFTGTQLQITNNPYFGKIVVKEGSTTKETYEYGTSSIDFNKKDGSGNYIYKDATEYTVSFGNGARAFIVKVKR